MILGDGFRGPDRSVLKVILSFFNSFTFAFCKVLKEHVNMMLLQESEQVNETLEVEQIFTFLFIIYMMDSKSEIVNISRDMLHKT